MGQANWLHTCHKNENALPEDQSAPDYSIRNSYQERKEIGPYMRQQKTNSYDIKLREWNQAIRATPCNQDKEFEREFQMHYQFCQQPLEQALKSYEIMSKKHYLDLVRQGPPQKLRWGCWKTLLMKSKYVYNPTIRSDQIYKDIKRTLVNHKFFQSDDGYAPLLNVLNAVSNRYPKLGYCQGMNFLAGFLLLVSGGDEQYSYQCFMTLLSHQKYMLYYVYDSELQLLGFLEHVTQRQMATHLPTLHKHFIELKYEHCFWLTKMILTLFLYNFKLELCLRIWDYLIAEGIFYISAIVITIMKQLQSKALEKNDFCQLATWFQSLDSEIIDVNCLKESGKYKISIEQLREYAVEYNKNKPLIVQLQQYPIGMKNFLMDNLL